MSTERTPITNTGKNDQELSITQFSGGSKGLMLQLTQGVSFNMHEPGFIQLTEYDAERLIVHLLEWLNQ